MKVNAKDAAMEATIGARVFIWRRRRGFTVGALADRAGLHKNTVKHLENGKGCSAVSLAKIAAALRVEIASLVPKGQCIVPSNENSLFE